MIYIINSNQVNLKQSRFEFMLWLDESDFFSKDERAEMLIFLLDELGGLAAVW